jgi:hypothetical protein
MRVHPCRSAFIIIFLLAKFSVLVNHIIVIQPSRSCGSLSCRFCLSTWLFIFYLGYFVYHLGLLSSFSDNFVCCLSLLNKDILLLLSTHSSSRHLIPLPAICRCASYLLESVSCIRGLDSVLDGLGPLCGGRPNFLPIYMYS